MKEIIDRLFDLYVINSNKYLIQSPGGDYNTIIYRKNNGGRDKPLLPFLMQQHLEQKKTVGVFAGNYYTKFICFDVDFKDPKMAKWITYKITNTLQELGIRDYHISNSGGKGYHIEIFIEDLISVTTAQRFFNLVINKADVFGFNGEVEFRPTAKQGVKIPLGINQKYYLTGGYCNFCEEVEGLREKSEEENYKYLLSIKKIKREVINDILNLENDNLNFADMEKKVKEQKKSTTLAKEIEKTEEILTQHKELPIYNPTESFTLEQITEIYEKGLSRSGTRHNACFNLAKFFKYQGLEQNEIEELIIEWMKKQDKRCYTTPLDRAIEDIKEIVGYVFKHDLDLLPRKKNIEVSFNEVNQIILNCPEKNQKLLLYAMLVHSKRYATNSGVFYMTFKQMEEVTGLDWRTCIRQVEKLEKLRVIEVVERNGNNLAYNRELGRPISKPNKYKISLAIEELGEIKHISNIEDNRVDDFKNCVKNYYTKAEIKKIIPRRQLEYFYNIS